MQDANSQHLDLQAVAKDVMMKRGFEPDFPAEVAAQLTQLRQEPPEISAVDGIRDLRSLLWSSIDNDTSRDLDQVEVAERGSNDDVKVMVGIADVDVFVPSLRRLISMRRVRQPLFTQVFATSQCFRRSYRQAAVRFSKIRTASAL